MSRKEGYRWRRGDWQPSARQREVLDLIAVGKTNVEIAAALGIGFAGAKWHVAELLSQTGCDDRRALAAWWIRNRHNRKQAFWPIVSWRLLWPVAVSIGVLAVLLTTYLSVGPEGDQAPGPEAAADFAPGNESQAVTPTVDPGPPPNCDAALEGGYGLVMADELRAQGLVEVGRVLEPRTCPLRVANRADRAFVWMADGAEIDLTGANLHLVSSFGNYGGSNYPSSDLGFYYDGEQYRAELWVLDDSGSVYVGVPSANVDVRVESRERIDIRRIGNSGAYASISLAGEASGDRRVAMASDGTLFFDPAPFPGELATNWLTGEQIDVNEMDEIGRVELWDEDSLRTDCWSKDGVCHVYLDGLGVKETIVGLPTLPSPVDGILGCVLETNPDGQEVLAYELDSGEVTLRLEAIGGSGESWQGGCELVRVATGDELELWTYTSLEALGGNGALSVVATRDGRLFVGDVDIGLVCPCSPRN